MYLTDVLMWKDHNDIWATIPPWSPSCGQFLLPMWQVADCPSPRSFSAEVEQTAEQQNIQGGLGAGFGLDFLIGPTLDHWTEQETLFKCKIQKRKQGIVQVGEKRNGLFKYISK